MGKLFSLPRCRLGPLTLSSGSSETARAPIRITFQFGDVLLETSDGDCSKLNGQAWTCRPWLRDAIGYQGFEVEGQGVSFVGATSYIVAN